MKKRVMLKMQLLDLAKPFLIFAVVMLGLSFLFVVGINAMVGAKMDWNQPFGNTMIVPTGMFTIVASMILTPKWLRLAAQFGIPRWQQFWTQLTGWLCYGLVGFALDWLIMTIFGVPMLFIKELGYSGTYTPVAWVANALFIVLVFASLGGIGMFFNVLMQRVDRVAAALTLCGVFIAVALAWFPVGRLIAPSDSAAAALTRHLASGSLTQTLPAAQANPFLIVAAALLVFAVIFGLTALGMRRMTVAEQ
ncbi:MULTISPECIES: hypothetical protein [unclassified Lacticaseibacillus]|uniref:hypothetical protein n=1 Tax=unclassified Lacticaseibacillus TaxID=2759744 RepID=UPI00194455D1|nr:MULTISPECIES: hypothetical protein [unclassified Lacticaseibacillus]